LGRASHLDELVEFRAGMASVLGCERIKSSLNGIARRELISGDCVALAQLLLQQSGLDLPEQVLMDWQEQIFTSH
jgi:hypothetical protein